MQALVLQKSNGKTQQNKEVSLYFNVTGYNAVRPIVMYVPLHCLVQRFTKIRKESTQTTTEIETKLKAL